MGIARRGSLAIVVVAALVSGCGGGSTASKRDFVAEGNAICRASDKAGEGGKVPKTHAELESVFARSLRLGQGELARLKTLQPPSAKAQAFHVWVSGLEETLRMVRGAQIASKSNNVNELRAIVSSGRALTKRNDANALATGLTVCAAS
jgi:hypothetical protein